MNIEEFFVIGYETVSAFLSAHPFLTIVLSTIISILFGGIKKMKEKTKGQVFPDTKPVYRLNKATGELEKTDEVVNIQELIDSVIPLTLENILSKFLPSETEEDKEVAYIEDMQSDLDIIQEAYQNAESLRVKYNIPDTVSTSDIYSYLNKQLNNVLDKRREVKPDEKDTEQKGE